MKRPSLPFYFHSGKGGSGRPPRALRTGSWGFGARMPHDTSIPIDSSRDPVRGGYIVFSHEIVCGNDKNTISRLLYKVSNTHIEHLPWEITIQ